MEKHFNYNRKAESIRTEVAQNTSVILTVNNSFNFFLLFLGHHHLKLSATYVISLPPPLHPILTDQKWLAQYRDFEILPFFSKCTVLFVIYYCVY